MYAIKLNYILRNLSLLYLAECVYMGKAAQIPALLL
jgi:hypothetical protein